MTTGDGGSDGFHDDRRGSDVTDALGHVLRAFQELLAAARTVIDAADGLVEEQLGSRRAERPPRVRRIDVDER
jgi:hypothetical protein